MSKPTSRWKSASSIIALVILGINLMIIIAEVIWGDLAIGWYWFLFLGGGLGAFLFLGFKQGLRSLAISYVALALWIYSEFLHESLSHTRITTSASVIGRTVTVVLVFVGSFLVNFLLPDAFKNFFGYIWTMLTLPGVARSLFHLILAYLVITGLFGLTYATIYLYAGHTSFTSSGQLQLGHFMYYSLFVPTTLGYPDITPNHWLARVVTLLELAFGLVVIVIYLGTIVGIITEHVSEQRRNPAQG